MPYQTWDHPHYEVPVVPEHTMDWLMHHPEQAVS